MPILTAPRFSIERPFGHEPGSVRRVRAAWISDVHLGTRGANAGALLDFLREYDFETLYIVGDLIDIWQLRRGIYWPQQHNDVIQKILRKSRKGTRTIYIPGNHDDLLAKFYGAYGNITVQKHAIHRLVDGRRVLVIHGHELDTVVQNVKWLAFAGRRWLPVFAVVESGDQFCPAPLRSRLLVAQRFREKARQRRGQLHRKIRRRDRSPLSPFRHAILTIRNLTRPARRFIEAGV